MGSRRKSRELAMQMLFQGDLGKQKPDEVERLFWESRDDVDVETRGFADDLHRVATQREDELVHLILALRRHPVKVIGEASRLDVDIIARLPEQTLHLIRLLLAQIALEEHLHGQFAALAATSHSAHALRRSALQLYAYRGHLDGRNGRLEAL